MLYRHLMVRAETSRAIALAISQRIQGVKCPHVLMPAEASPVDGGQSVEELGRVLAEARQQQADTAEILAAILSSVTDANLFASRRARPASVTPTTP